MVELPTWLFKVALPSQSIFGSNSADLLSSVKKSPVAILGLQGDDTINSQNATDYVYAGLGKDVIRLNSSKDSANLARGGEGADTIFYGDSSGLITQDGESKCSLQGDKGDDSIRYEGSATNIVVDAAFGGGQGADTLYLSGPQFVNSTITGGMNNDSIRIAAASFTTSEVNGAMGADTISYTAVSGALGSIYGGVGNDTISLRGSVGKVMGGLGKDTITSGPFAATDAIQSVNGISILGGGSDDSIALTSFTGTVRGDGSADTANDGKDVITLSAFGGGEVYGDGLADKITITAPSASATVGGGLGGDTISITDIPTTGTKDAEGNANQNLVVNGGYGLDSIAIDLVKVGGVVETTTDVSVTINGGEGNDTITTHIKNATIFGGDNDDRISLAAINGGFIDGGNGADAIIADSYNNTTTLKGGAGNDTFTFSGQKKLNTSNASIVAVDGGAGADTFALNTTITPITGKEISEGKANLFVTKGSGDKIFLNEDLNGGFDFNAIKNLVVVNSSTLIKAEVDKMGDDTLAAYQSGDNTFYYLKNVVAGEDKSIGFAINAKMYDNSNFKFVDGVVNDATLASVGLTATVTENSGITFGII